MYDDVDARNRLGNGPSFGVVHIAKLNPLALKTAHAK